MGSKSYAKRVNNVTRRLTWIAAVLVVLITARKVGEIQALFIREPYLSIQEDRIILCLDSCFLPKETHIALLYANKPLFWHMSVSGSYVYVQSLHQELSWHICWMYSTRCLRLCSYWLLCFINFLLLLTGSIVCSAALTFCVENIKTCSKSKSMASVKRASQIRLHII